MTMRFVQIKKAVAVRAMMTATKVMALLSLRASALTHRLYNKTTLKLLAGVSAVDVDSGWLQGWLKRIGWRSKGKRIWSIASKTATNVSKLCRGLWLTR